VNADNWMLIVASSCKTSSTQNLVANDLNGYIYFTTTRPLAPGTELYVRCCCHRRTAAQNRLQGVRGREIPGEKSYERMTKVYKGVAAEENGDSTGSGVVEYVTKNRRVRTGVEPLSTAASKYNP